MLLIKYVGLNEIADELFKLRLLIKQHTKREEQLKKKILDVLEKEGIDQFFTEDYEINKRTENKETISPKLFFNKVPKDSFFECCSINKQKATGFLGANDISDISTTKPVVKLLVSEIEANEEIEIKQMEA
jgi:hypothetical protein